MASFDNTEVAFRSKSDYELKRAHLLFRIMNKQWIVQLGKVLLNISMFLHLPVKFMIKSTIFKHFCGGENMNESEEVIQKLAQYNVKTILDYSVEGKEEEKEFEKSYRMILETVENAARHEDIPFAVFKVTGMGRFALLQKVNEKKELSESETEEFQRLHDRVEGICKRGYELSIPILIDAEESWIQDSIDDLCHEMMRTYNKEKCIVYNTAQLYRHDRLAFLKKEFEVSKNEGYWYGIKLVRGAYLEKERERAEKLNYRDPIQKTKADTDRDFNDSIQLCMDNLDHVAFCCGSHNEESSKLLHDLIEQKNIDKADSRVYFAQLLGMSDHISFNLSDEGYNVAKYVPFGPVYDVTPYLIRRTEENSSISGQSSRELLLIQKELKRRKASV